MLSDIQRKLRSNQPVLGTWAIVPSSTLVEIGALAGLDFIILDMEHGAYDLSSIASAIRACEGAGCVPLVRVPGLQAATFQSILDLGAHGIVVPQIQNVADAERAVRYAKYPPRGLRGYNPFVRAAGYSAPPTIQEGKLDPDFGLLSVIIENESSYVDLDRILSIPEIDVVYLGVYDMSLALGCAGDTNHSKVVEFVDNAAKQIVEGGKTVGMMVRTDAEMARALEIGAQFLVFSVDSHVIYRAWKQPVETFRSLLAERGQ